MDFSCAPTQFFHASMPCWSRALRCSGSGNACRYLSSAAGLPVNTAMNFFIVQLLSGGSYSMVELTPPISTRGGRIIWRECRNPVIPFDQDVGPHQKEPAMATKRKVKKSSSRTLQSQQRSGIQVISPCLWFDSQAEDAARFYVSVFKKGKIVTVNRYPAVGQEIHRREPGSVMTVDFVLNGLPFTALNGGPIFKFNETVSLQVLCRTQKGNDHYLGKHCDSGAPERRPTRSL